MIIPSITETEGNITRTSDPYSRLLQDRIVMVQGEVTSEMASSIVAQLFALESQDPTQDITMLIDSPGGSIQAGWAITDTMEYISCDVATVGIGIQASMGSFILASGTKGKRYATKRSSIMIHRLSGGTQGDYYAMESTFKNMQRTHEQLTRDYVRLSGNKKTYEEFLELMKEDTWLTPEQAIELGLIDGIKCSRAEENEQE